jgi:cytochrome c nitrite reductase small subunit
MSPRTAVLLFASAMVGALISLGLFTFGYAEGGSYLGNDSNSCANCHVMQGHLDAWAKSSHGKFTECNDCHAPRNTIEKYYCKSRNGLFHSLAFTTGQFPDRIIMHDYNRDVVEQNCRACHTNTIEAIDLTACSDVGGESISCLHCHAKVGHDTP